jgi:hypothetical protein
VGQFEMWRCSGVENGLIPAHIGRMTARDRFKAYLKCSKCGKTGVAALSELDGYSYRPGQTTTMVDHLPRGFKIVNQPSDLASVDLFCEKCDVSAITKANKPQ